MHFQEAATVRRTGFLYGGPGIAHRSRYQFGCLRNMPLIPAQVLAWDEADTLKDVPSDIRSKWSRQVKIGLLMENGSSQWCHLWNGDEGMGITQ